MDHLAGLLGIDANQRSNGVQSVEQKVRIDLAAERRQTRLIEPLLLLFHFLFIAIAVPHLDGESGGEQSGGVDGDGHPRSSIGPLLLQREHASTLEMSSNESAEKLGEQD